jgi:hypothetical protein
LGTTQSSTTQTSADRPQRRSDDDACNDYRGQEYRACATARGPRPGSSPFGTGDAPTRGFAAPASAQTSRSRRDSRDVIDLAER